MTCLVFFNTQTPSARLETILHIPALRYYWSIKYCLIRFFIRGLSPSGNSFVLKNLASMVSLPSALRTPFFISFVTYAMVTGKISSPFGNLV